MKPHKLRRDVSITFFVSFLQGGKFYKSRRETFGHVYKTHILGRPTVRVIGSDNVAKIIRGEGTLVTSQWPYSVRMLLGDGLTFAEGDVHRRRRRAVLRAFDSSSLASYVQGMEDIVTEMVREWCETKKPILLQPKIKEMTFRIAADCLLGLDFRGSELTEWSNLYRVIVNNIFSLPVKIPGFGLHKVIIAKCIVLFLTLC